MRARTEQINLNDASIAVLETVLHDRERANQLLNARELSGDFRDWTDVKERLIGFDDAAIASLQEAGVTIGAEGKPGALHRGDHGAKKHAHATARSRS